MKLTVERMPESVVVLDITAEDEEYSKALDKAVRKVSQQITIPGFRKGKAPRNLIERYYGPDIFAEETRRELMDQLYRRALEEANLNIVGQPEVEVTEFEPLSFKVKVPVYPEVDPGAYLDVRVESVEAGLSDEDVAKAISDMQKANSAWVDPSGERLPQDGDQVTIDLAVSENGEQFEEPITDAVFVIGESNLFDELKTEILKLKVGETAKATVTFAEDNEEVSERVRGKTLEYDITLRGLKERELVALDDEFAKSVADVETFADLETKVREDLHRTKTTEARTEVINEIVNKMSETASIEIPPVMIDDAATEEINNLARRLTQQRGSLAEYLRMTGMTEQGLREEVRPTVARRLRNSLLMSEISRREVVTVTDEDIDAEIDEVSVGQENGDALRELYKAQPYFRNMLRSDLFDRKLTDRMIEIATEGRGAVLNGWVEPKPVAAEETAAVEETAVAEETATVE